MSTETLLTVTVTILVALVGLMVQALRSLITTVGQVDKHLVATDTRVTTLESVIVAINSHVKEIDDKGPRACNIEGILRSNTGFGPHGIS